MVRNLKNLSLPAAQVGSVEAAAKPLIKVF